MMSQIISRVLDSLSEDSELYGDTCETLMDKMLVRINDKVPAVRVQAIKALVRLQVLLLLIILLGFLYTTKFSPAISVAILY